MMIAMRTALLAFLVACAADGSQSQSIGEPPGSGFIWTCYEPSGGHFEYCVNDPKKLPAADNCIQGEIDPLLGPVPMVCRWACPTVSASDCLPGRCICP